MLVCLQSSWMMWSVPPQVDRRWKDNPSYHYRADAIEHSVGSPTPTGRHDGGVPSGGLYLLARPRADARDHHPALPATDAARPCGVQPRAASVGCAMQRLGLLASPHETPPPPLWAPVDPPLHFRTVPPIR
jgi:hypothetical protein